MGAMRAWLTRVAGFFAGRRRRDEELAAELETRLFARAAGQHPHGFVGVFGLSLG